MNVEAKRAALFDRTPTPTLVAAMLQLDEIPDRTPEQATTRVWIIDEIERRYPEASEAMSPLFEDDAPDLGLSYALLLLAALPATALGACCSEGHVLAEVVALAETAAPERVEAARAALVAHVRGHGA